MAAPAPQAGGVRTAAWLADGMLPARIREHAGGCTLALQTCVCSRRRGEALGELSACPPGGSLMVPDLAADARQASARFLAAPEAPTAGVALCGAAHALQPHSCSCPSVSPGSSLIAGSAACPAWRAPHIWRAWQPCRWWQRPMGRRPARCTALWWWPTPSRGPLALLSCRRSLCPPVCWCATWSGHCRQRSGRRRSRHSRRCCAASRKPLKAIKVGVR